MLGAPRRRNGTCEDRGVSRDARSPASGRAAWGGADYWTRKRARRQILGIMAPHRAGVCIHAASSALGSNNSAAAGIEDNQYGSEPRRSPTTFRRPVPSAEHVAEGSPGTPGRAKAPDRRRGPGAPLSLSRRWRRALRRALAEPAPP